MNAHFRTVLVAAVLAASGAARAAGEPVSLLLPVTYEFETSVLHKTKESCKLEDKLTSAIGAEFQKRAGRPGTTSSQEGVVLRVVIVGSGGIGGGGWTGSKSLTVRAEELRNGQLVRSRGFIRKSRGGFAGPFEGTCGILEGIAETLATDIVGWSGTQTDAAFDTDAATRSAAAAQDAAQAAQGAAQAAQAAASDAR